MKKDLQTLEQKIAEKIGEELVDLIPKDQWQAIVHSEITKFKAEVLPDLIQKALLDYHKENVVNLINGLINPEWSTDFQEQTYKELEIFIGKSSGVILAAMLSPSMGMALQDLRNRLY